MTMLMVFSKLILWNKINKLKFKFVYGNNQIWYKTSDLLFYLFLCLFFITKITRALMPRAIIKLNLKSISDYFMEFEFADSLIITQKINRSIDLQENHLPVASCA